jgi:hypothetical protein
MLRSMSRFAILLGIVALVVMAGCDNGSDGIGNDGQDPNLGSVSGRVVNGLTNPQPFGEITVWVGLPATPRMFSAVSRTDDGTFVVHNVTPRTVPSTAYQVTVEIDPVTDLVPAAPDNVAIETGPTTNLYLISDKHPYAQAGVDTPIGDIQLVPDDFPPLP